MLIANVFKILCQIEDKGKYRDLQQALCEVMNKRVIRFWVQWIFGSSGELAFSDKATRIRHQLLQDTHKKMCGDQEQQFEYQSEQQRLQQQQHRDLVPAGERRKLSAELSKVGH